MKVECLVDANAYLDEAAREVGPQLPGGPVVMIGALPGGMTSGMPSVMIAAEVEGRRVFVQASMKVFLLAAQQLAAAYPKVLESPLVFATQGDKAIVQMVPEGHVGVVSIVPAPPPPKSDDEVN